VIDRKKVAFSALRTNQVFNGFVKELEQVLADERETYENNEASEYRRGRVNALRELIADITGSSR
jgi:hypothetical protein